MKSRDIALILLIISSFSYGTGILQFTVRLGLLPLALLFSCLSTNFTIPNRLFSRKIPIILLGLTVLILLNYLINIFTIKAVWKFVELILLILTTFNICRSFSRSNIAPKLLIGRAFFIINIIVFCSVAVQGALGDLKLTEISGAFPIINANSIGSIYGIQFIYFLILKKYIKSFFSMILVLVSGSFSAFLAIQCALCFYFMFIMLKKIRNMNASLALNLIIIISLLCCFYIASIVSEEFLRLSGRADMWMSMFNFLTGSLTWYDGVGLGMVKETGADAFGKAKTLHNSYLEILFSIGWLGLTLYLILHYLFLNMKVSIFEKDKFGGAEAAMMVFILTKALTTSNLIYLTIELVIYSLIVCRIYSPENLTFKKRNSLFQV